MAKSPATARILALALLSVAVGCARGTTSVGTGAGGGPAGTGGGAASGSGGSGAGGATGAGGAAIAGTGGSGTGGGAGAGAGTGGQRGGGTGGASPTPDGGGADHVCQMAEYTFEPKVPTVYLMVDRSSSMFACVGETNNMAPPCATPANSYWDRLHQSIVQVVQQLDAQVRFGFATFSGTNGGTCPDIRKVSPALNNGDAIVTLYNSLPFRGANDKWETPMRRTLEMLGAELTSITAPGDKYLLLVTDGEPDYCGDGNLLCPPDSVVAELQTLKAAGITTIVFGLQSKVGDISPSVLQSFANAGAGEATVAPLRTGATVMSIFDQCFPGGDSSTAGWRADFLAKYPECATDSNMCRGRTIGTYGSTAGPTKPYTPDPSNQAQLVQQLTQVLSNVKSCVFDLGDINGTSIKVDLTQLDQARVLIQGKTIARDDTNGWRMNSATQLELRGTACTTWKTPGNDMIDFQFPCSTIIFE